MGTPPDDALLAAVRSIGTHPQALQACLAPCPPAGEERTEVLLQRPGLRVERIISNGSASPPDFWYQQAEDEWVTVLTGRGVIAFETQPPVTLRPGDHLWIPAGQRHRVAETQGCGPANESPTLWLAVFVTPVPPTSP